MVPTTHVLIADDRLCARKGLRALLAGWPGLVVTAEAADGPETIGRLETCRPDVVLMDVRMPGIDGLEVTRRIKRRWPEVRVVLLSMDGGYQADALAAGADAFLVKGCPSEALLNAIVRLHD
jgi:DNA-binding NarL/FixJ family response regulator